VSNPLLSFIVLSYNYEDYIGTTLRSILDQTVTDFEVIVVDDASTDRSREVVRSFADPRIRLIVNQQNLGGAGAYNVAVSAARGTWLVNLDADDWILPEKSARQLELAARDPSLDVIGTWVSIVGPDGAPHPDAEAIEPAINGSHPLNFVDTWIGANHLCRSSTMVRRSAHLRVGLDDPAMVRACDYELWTRFLKARCRFAVLPEKLTFMRVQPRGVTKGDRVGTLLELAWAGIRNLLPVIEERALWPSFERLCTWLVNEEQLAALEARQRERLLSMLVAPPAVPDFAAFKQILATHDPEREALGRRVLTLARRSSELAHWSPTISNVDGLQPGNYVAKLEHDIRAYIEARDFWKGQSDAWEAAYQEAASRPPPQEQAAEHPRSRPWRRRYWRFFRSS
jgi:glycosyltransferase involved in cell wall biosynthesis